MFCKFVLAAVSAMRTRWQHRMILTTLIIILLKSDLCGRYRTNDSKPIKKLHHIISASKPPSKMGKKLASVTEN